MGTLVSMWGGGSLEAQPVKRQKTSETSTWSPGNVLSQLGPGWAGALEKYVREAKQFQQLLAFVNEQMGNPRLLVFPPKEEIFSAFTACSLNKTKVVIIGQDPYHSQGQAHGMCFSVRKGVRIPPSLANIYKELGDDVDGFKAPSHGHLAAWASQGVLLLNAVLTVEAGKAASHQKKGWEHFTDRVIETLDKKRSSLVFLLWGGYAQSKGKKIDRTKHKVLTAAHPSPLSANRGGWFGCKHFSATNTFLKENKETPINWRIS